MIDFDYNFAFKIWIVEMWIFCLDMFPDIAQSERGKVFIASYESLFEWMIDLQCYAVGLEMLCHISFPPPVVFVDDKLPVIGQLCL